MRAVMKKTPPVFCPCGSGKKYARCCVSAGPARRQALLQEAMVWQQQGDIERALSRYQNVLKNDKRNAPASYLCGTVFQQRGDFKRTLLYFERAFKLGLKNPAAKIQYVYALLSTGQIGRAIKTLKKILANPSQQAQSNQTQACLLLANLYFESEDFPQAEKHYRQLLVQPEVSWSLHFNLGHTLYHLTQIPEAIEQFRTALSLNSNNAEIYASLATVYQLDNQLNDARINAQKALTLQADNISATIVLVRLLRNKKKYLPALEVLNQSNPTVLEPSDQVLWWHEYGLLLDSLQRYKQAFKAFSSSRQVLSDLRSIAYDATPIAQHLSASETVFSNDKLLKSVRFRPTLPDNAEAPIQVTRQQPMFITGFYRSGTTLLEQMLSSHHNICGVGEASALANAENRIKDLLGSPYPDCFKKKRPEKYTAALQQLRKDYWQEIISLDGFQKQVPLVIDKNPFNMLRLPLIHMMFPTSRVVHMLRHPLDIVLSCYMTLFLDRNEWSFAMPDIARMFVRCYYHVQQMQKLLGDRYYPLHYEKLISEPEKELRDLLTFLGKAWDKHCLQFYNNPSIARTASYEQVRQRLYTSSVFRYKNYLEFIDKQVIQILEPVIIEMGYQIEN